VRHELAQKSITITQMSDPQLVDDAIAAIKTKGKATGERATQGKG